jgi:RNA polymerase sigma factor (sigma-70 family)
MASAVPELPLLARDQAFEAIYRRHVEDVYHYALALLRNPADAEDVTQTTFMNAYRAFRRGDEIQKPQNWLIKIAHNVARTRYARASRRVKEVPLEDHVEQLAVPEVDKPNLDGVLEALGRLPFNQRAAIVMRELEGRSYAEIADTLNVSISAVETLIFRARKALRLRASALRVITAVPLPGSLAAFEGGAFVAGGSAIVGTGFIAKAAVALIAGVVATGVGGDKGERAEAAGQGRPAIASVWDAPDGFMVRWLPVAGSKGIGTTNLVQRARASEERGRHARATLRGARGLPAQTASSTEATMSNATASGQSTPAGPAAAAKAATTQVTTTASTIVGTVQETVTSTAPSLPSVPSLPPVQAPEVPVKPPPLPPVPTLPVAPPALPEPPPPPPLPKLP